MTHVTCRLTAKNRDQLRNPTLGNRVLATFAFLVVCCGECCHCLLMFTDSADGSLWEQLAILDSDSNDAPDRGFTLGQHCCRGNIRSHTFRGRAERSFLALWVPAAPGWSELCQVVQGMQVWCSATPGNLEFEIAPGISWVLLENFIISCVDGVGRSSLSHARL